MVSDFVPLYAPVPVPPAAVPEWARGLPPPIARQVQTGEVDGGGQVADVCMDRNEKDRAQEGPVDSFGKNRSILPAAAVE